MDFRRGSVFNNLTNGSLNIGKLAGNELSNEEIRRLERIREEQNFYEGYHWEGIDDEDSPQVTFNFVRSFVTKFVAFELGKGFTIEIAEGIKDTGVTVGDTKIDTDLDKNSDGMLSAGELVSEPGTTEKTTLDFLNEVWTDNEKEIFCEELGQVKSITGEAWVKIDYLSPEDLADNPLDFYDKGKIKLRIIPTQYVFPRFDQHDIKKLESLVIMYPVEKTETTGILRNRSRLTTVIYKEHWTNTAIHVYEDGNLIDEMENPYKIIPFVQIKNRPLAGRTYGFSDIDDLIPLNVEYNIKKSDVSEIIDYHAAPVTLVYGAKIGNLEKGANKVWGGLPKDAKVHNLELTGDLVASNKYIDGLKTSMCEIAGVPESVLGGASAISNTSGVALQYMNGSLIDITNTKRHCTSTGLQKINKIILYIAYIEGLINKPDNISLKDFLYNKVKLPDTLPKDKLIELQIIQQELVLGLECRHGAMERLGKERIDSKLDEIDQERSKYPELFNPALQSVWYNNINSGMTNGQTPVEQVRTEMTGSNGMTPGQE